MIRLIKDADIYSTSGEKIGNLDRVVLGQLGQQAAHVALDGREQQAARGIVDGQRQLSRQR